MITKSHTTNTLLVLAAVAATLLAAGTVVTASNHSAFAWKDKDYKKEKYQKDEMKYQNNESDNKYAMGSERGSGTTTIASNEQSAQCETAGGGSPITGSCTQTATATASNTGGILGGVPVAEPR